MGGPVPQELAPKKGQFTMDSTCAEMMEDSLVMRLQYHISRWVISRVCGTRDPADPGYRMMMNDAGANPLSGSLSFSYQGFGVSVSSMRLDLLAVCMQII